MFVLSSPSSEPAGILLATTLTKVILVLRAFSKCYLRKGFLNLIPSRTSVYRHLFLAIASASVIKLPSSDKSLFLEISREVIPVFLAIYAANISKPLSLK